MSNTQFSTPVSSLLRRISRNPIADTDHESTEKPASTPGTRDAGIDLVRIACLVVVMLLHALMVGVGRGPDGPVIGNAFEGSSGFAAFTWFVQIMPLFFIAGGFSAITQYRSMTARGAGAGDYIHARLIRLAKPATALVAVVGTCLLLLMVSGVPADLVETAGFRISQPLWFLAVYLGCSAGVPLMVWLHESKPRACLLVLVGGIATTDAIRISAGIEGFGYLNLLFVWLFCQQLGFWLADGTVDLVAPRIRLAIAASAVFMLLGLTLGGTYSGDMLVNLNPPTVALALLAMAQLMLFSLARPAIRQMAGTRIGASLIGVLGRRTMSLYLWHMPILVLLAGVLLVLPVELPTPTSAAWWAGRPWWFLAAAVALIPVMFAVDRFEKRPRSLAHKYGVFGACLGAACSVLGVVVLLIDGITPFSALIGTFLLGLALAISSCPAEPGRLLPGARSLARPRFAKLSERA